MNRIAAFFAATAMSAIIASQAAAMGSNPDAPTKSPAARNGGYTEAEKVVKARQYEDAIKKLEAVLAKDPNNVDALNYLAYSHRELGRFDTSMGYYQKALALNPNHRGANEYLGQLYLRMGKLAEARAQLAKLHRICGRGCEEYESLRSAIGKANGPS